MRYFLLRLYVLLLIEKNITSNKCPSDMTSTPYCICRDIRSIGYVDINCTRPLLNTNSNNMGYFKVNFFTDKVELTCFHSPNWSKFHYNFGNHMVEQRVLSLENCTLEKNTNLSEFAKHINAINVQKLEFTNTIQLDTIGFNKELFKEFHKVETLFIMNDNLKIIINNDLLDFFSNISTFFLINCKLISNRDNFFKLPSTLRYLRLNYNDIHYLEPRIFKNLNILKYLDLSYNKINDFEHDIFDAMINLETLSLNNNNFTWLPEYAFKKLTNLKYLDLTSTGLISLLETIFRNNKKLTSLNLQNNQLKTLPSEIFHELINLETLNIGNNQMEQIPQDIFSKLVNLTSLNLSGNKFKSFSDRTFQNLIKLQNLNLRQNQLDNLADSRFESRVMGYFINTLKIFDTLWTKDYPFVSIFFNCLNLMHLDLSYNNIKKIYDDWFLLSKLKLQSLNLDHNKISELDFNQGLVQINNFSIDLSHNQLAAIVPFNLSNIKITTPVPITVIINDNPINCECQISGLLEYQNSKRMKFLNIIMDNLKCQRPKNLEGHLLSFLKVDHLFCEPSLLLHNNDNSLCNKKCDVKIDIEKQQPMEINGTNENEIYKFNCTNKYLRMLPKDICIVPGTSVELDLTNNEFDKIPIFDNKYYCDAVRKLILSNNSIYNLQDISSYKNLEILEINYNQKTAWEITENEINEISNMKHLQQISLHRSLFVCNNNINNLKNYRMFKLISNVRQLSCVQPDTNELIYPFEKLTLSQ
ncbi:toll-like receptor 6 [Leptopilina boulardi]|uniref:toll-like receptor 6 n=1 Tax=Leptopilina boulardi TaxID=63433 RepID=UPI0021F51A83|nr:toll-like receptor 6 [Leptopilina boulardi]